MRSILSKVQSFREAFRTELRVCERCGRGKPQLHEITQGYGRRVRALGCRSLIVGLCSRCHREIHSMGLLGKITCLAIIYLRRPKDYSLQMFWEVNGRCWPDQEEVVDAAKKILREE